jgi:hypothetical protein
VHQHLLTRLQLLLLPRQLHHVEVYMGCLLTTGLAPCQQVLVVQWHLHQLLDRWLVVGPRLACCIFLCRAVNSHAIVPFCPLSLMHVLLLLLRFFECCCMFFKVLQPVLPRCCLIGLQACRQSPAGC